MAKVYYFPNAGKTVQEISQNTRKLLEKVVEKEKIEWKDSVPLKVHFGENKKVK